MSNLLNYMKKDIEQNILKFKPIDRLLEKVYYKQIKKREHSKFFENEFNKKEQIQKLLKELEVLTDKKLNSLAELNNYLENDNLYQILIKDKKISPSLHRRIDLYEKSRKSQNDVTSELKEKLRIINRLAIEEICENAPNTKPYKKLETETFGNDKDFSNYIIKNRYKNLKIVVSSESGMGKTWLLAKLFLSLYDEINESRVLPYYFKLSNMKNDLTSNFKNPLHFDERVHKKDYTPILLLDGFNEISDRERMNLNIFLKDIEESYPYVCWIMTTQPQTIKKSWLEDYPIEQKKNRYDECYQIKEITDDMLDKIIENHLRAEDDEVLYSDINRLKKFMKGLDISIKRNPYYVSCICSLYKKNEYSTDSIPNNLWEIIDLVLEKKWAEDFQDLSTKDIINLKLTLGLIGMTEILTGDKLIFEDKTYELLEKFEDAEILNKKSKSYCEQYLLKKGQWKDIFSFDHDRTKDYAVGYLLKYLLNDWQYSDKEFKEWLFISSIFKENLLEPLCMISNQLQIKNIYNNLTEDIRKKLTKKIISLYFRKPITVLNLIDQIDDIDLLKKVMDKFFNDEISDIDLLLSTNITSIFKERKNEYVFIFMTSILKKRIALLTSIKYKINGISSRLNSKETFFYSDYTSRVKLIKGYIILFLTDPVKNKYLIPKILKILRLNKIIYKLVKDIHITYLSYILSELVQRDETVKETIIEMLEMKGKYVRELIINSLSGIIHLDERVRDKIINLIEDKNEFIREAVIKSLKISVEHGDKKSINIVLNALKKDANYHVRAAAIKCLEPIIKKKETIKKAVISCLKDAGYLIKVEAIKALSKSIEDDYKIKDAIIQKLNDNDYLVKVTAIEVLSPLLRQYKELQNKFVDLWIQTDHEYSKADKAVWFALKWAFRKNNYNVEEIREIINRINVDRSNPNIKKVIDTFSKSQTTFDNPKLSKSSDKTLDNVKKTQILEDEIIFNAIKNNLNIDDFYKIVIKYKLKENLIPKHYKEISDLRHIGNHTNKRDFIDALYEKHFPLNNDGSRSVFFHSNDKKPIFFNYYTFSLSKYLENVAIEQLALNNQKMDAIKETFELHFIGNIGFSIKEIENICNPCRIEMLNISKAEKETMLAHKDKFLNHLKNIIDNATKHKKNRCRVIIAKVDEKKPPIIAVVDDGDGFPAKETEIKELFQIGTTKRQGGTGQGLTKEMINDFNEMGFKFYIKNRCKVWHELNYTSKGIHIKTLHKNINEEIWKDKNNYIAIQLKAKIREYSNNTGGVIVIGK